MINFILGWAISVFFFPEILFLPFSRLFRWMILLRTSRLTESLQILDIRASLHTLIASISSLITASVWSLGIMGEFSWALMIDSFLRVPREQAYTSKGNPEHKWTLLCHAQCGVNQLCSLSFRSSVAQFKNSFLKFIVVILVLWLSRNIIRTQGWRHRLMSLLS